MSSRFSYHGALQCTDNYSRTSLYFMDEPHLSFSISCPFVLMLYVLRMPYIFLSLLLLLCFFIFYFTHGPIRCVSIMAFRLSRQTPCGLSWLVLSLWMLNLVVYKQQNTSTTLLISKIFLPDTCHLEPRLEVSLRLQSSSIQSQVFSPFSSLGFPFKFSSKNV